MRWIHRWVQRARNLIFRARWEREAEDEMRFHVEMEAQERIAAGMDPREAGRTAAADFGGIERYRQQARDSLWTSAGDHLVRDTRYAFRTLRRSPGFTVAVVLTLALGVGANTAVFSVVNGVLLSPLPYPAPDELHRIHTSWAGTPDGAISPAEFIDYKTDLTVFSDVGVYSFGLGQEDSMEVGLGRTGALRIKRGADGTPRRLFYQGKNEFHPAGAPAVRIRFDVKNERASALTIYDPEPIFTARRETS